jgi:hypothetical protein
VCDMWGVVVCVLRTGVQRAGDALQVEGAREEDHGQQVRYSQQLPLLQQRLHEVT